MVQQFIYIQAYRIPLYLLQCDPHGPLELVTPLISDSMTMSPNCFLLKNHPPPEARKHPVLSKKPSIQRQGAKGQDVADDCEPNHLPKVWETFVEFCKDFQQFPKIFPTIFFWQQKKIRTGHTAVKGVGHFNESKIFHTLGLASFTTATAP